jgi:hypothetical protein
VAVGIVVGLTVGVAVKVAVGVAEGLAVGVAVKAAVGVASSVMVGAVTVVEFTGVTGGSQAATRGSMATIIKTAVTGCHIVDFLLLPIASSCHASLVSWSRPCTSFYASQ